MPLKPMTQAAQPSEDARIEHERLNILINSMTDGVIATDENGVIQLYNAAVLDLLDRNTSITNMPVENVLPLLDQNSQPVDVQALLRSVHIPTISRDYRIQYPSDKSIINIYVSIAPVHLCYGKSGQGGYVIVLRNITREKSLEEERDEFIHVASHELRTPVAITEGNIGNAQFIVSKGGSIDEVSKALDSAHKQVMFLTDMINDLTTLSRADRGKLQMDVEVLNCHDLMVELHDNYNNQAAAKGLKLSLDLDPHLELIHSSKLYVREILQNFITNAIKYTVSGGVTLAAHPREGGVQFSVSDTGIGISKSDQEKVFGKFFRSEDYRTRQNNGTGLGLYVTQKLVKLIHGQITMTSKLNEGSTFSLYVPDLPPSDTAAKA